MISCERAWELLSQQLDEPISPQEQEELEAHLAACPACRKDQEELEQLDRALRDLGDIPAPADFTAQVMAQVRAEPRQSPKVLPLWRRPQVRALAGLAACALLCIGIYRVVPQESDRSGGMVTTSDLTPAQQQTQVADGSAGSAGSAQEEQLDQTQPDNQEAEPPAAAPRTMDPQPETDQIIPQTEQQPEQTVPYSTDSGSSSQSGNIGGQSKNQTQTPQVATASVQTELVVKTLSEQALALLPAQEDWSVDGQGNTSCVVTSQVLEQLCHILDGEGTEYTVTPTPWSETCIVRLG